MTDKQQRFCEINGFPDYIIYENGNVYSKYRLDANNHYKGGFFRKIQLTKNGYHSIILNGSGGYKRLYIHRIVAIHFIDNPNVLPQVNHKDGDKLNNTISNLEWVSDSENKHHASKAGLLNSKTIKKTKSIIKSNRAKRKLNKDIIFEMKQLRDKGLSYNKIAIILNVSSATICNFFNGKINYMLSN